MPKWLLNNSIQAMKNLTRPISQNTDPTCDKMCHKSVTKCRKCYTTIWIYMTIWSSSSYSWNWTGLLYFRNHHIYSEFRVKVYTNHNSKESSPDEKRVPCPEIYGPKPIYPRVSLSLFRVIILGWWKDWSFSSGSPTRISDYDKLGSKYKNNHLK